ncbi:hypothetical protein [Streptomyces sp. UNOC14_S4]|uniref:hypothetical protein n=1 Tax=Streptomyces sp. UNOC14_S4 TaxID=2872340 RepID=UPI001E31930E|nr:hypothetical protein [Streptomyces sp. UNOC14_S4]MCC3770031.1 hypothetical protein [Streptomyces sp. UNOC14_S4]
MTYGVLPPLGALGVGGASALSTRRPGSSGFQALATVVAATTLIMAGTSLCKLLPPRSRFTEATVTWHTPRRTAFHDRSRRDGTAWIAVP